MDTQYNQTPVESTAPIENSKTTPTVFILLLILFSLLFGVGGFYLGSQSVKQQQRTTSAVQVETPIGTTQPTVQPTLVTTYEIYTSSYEKLSFEYPSDWTLTPSQPKTNMAQADTMTLQSPTGKIRLEWVSAIDGLGGGCDPNLTLGSRDGCPLYEVIEKQMIPNSSFYFVSYLITSDGVEFSPALAIQDENGILTTARTKGPLTFTGKNNGGLSAVFVSGSMPSGVGTLMGESEARQFFSSPEAAQAKSIFMSVRY